jgi:hypothetical protein
MATVNALQRLGNRVSHHHFTNMERHHKRPGNLRIPIIELQSRKQRVTCGLGTLLICAQAASGKRTLD